MHHHEITYAFAIPAKNGHGFVQPLYDLVHQSLVDELSARQVPAEQFVPEGTAKVKSASEPFMCFSRRAPGDVILGGTKILGSAQRRSAAAVLQHGSLLLRRSPFAPKLLGLNDLDPKTTKEALVTDWFHRVAAQLDEKFEPRTLADHECDQINYAACDKFGAERWAMRR